MSQRIKINKYLTVVLFIRVHKLQPEHEYNLFIYSCFLFIHVTTRVFDPALFGCTLMVSEV